MSFKKRHGGHNKSLCDNLYTAQTHNDWVITTAFYSCIHYIDHLLFPLSHHGSLFNSIEQANNYLGTPSRHVARKRLVQLYLADQLDNYNYLDKSCRNARYIDYQVNAAKSEIAKTKAELLIQYCLAKKP